MQPTFFLFFFFTFSLFRLSFHIFLLLTLLTCERDEKNEKMELESRIEPTARSPQATGSSSYWKTCYTVVLEVSSLCVVSAVVRKHKLCGVVKGGVAAAPLTVGCSL